MSQVTIRLFSRWGSLFAGEVGTYPPEVADMLVREKRGKRVLPNGEFEPWADEIVPVAAVDEIKAVEDPGFAIDPARDPFILDGLDEPTSTALHAGGLHTPGDVEKYINDGKSLTELANIAAGRAKKIIDLYVVK